MKDVTISWGFQPIADNPGGTVIQRVQVEISADAGVTFTKLGDVIPPDNSLFIQQLDVGQYIARCIVIDVDDVVTQTVDTPFEVVDVSAPSQIVNVVVNFS